MAIVMTPQDDDHSYDIASIVIQAVLLLLTFLQYLAIRSSQNTDTTQPDSYQASVSKRKDWIQMIL